MNKRLKIDFWTYITLIIAVIFALFLVYPLFSLFISSFKDPETGAWTLDNFLRFFSRKYYYQALVNSFSVTICVTILAIVIGTPMAYFMSVYKIKGKTFLEILIIISMMSPAFIGAYSWILLLGRSGVVTKFFAGFGISTPTIYGFGGILLVFTLKLYPFIFMYVSGALSKIDVSLMEAAESLGCSPFKKVVTIAMPLITPTILAGSLLVFMNALADFGTPMLIGEGYRTMPTMIYSEFVSEVGGNANFSASMASIMVFITAMMFIAQKYFVNKKSFTMSSMNPIKPKEIKGVMSVLVHIFIYFIVFLSIIPQITVIYTSFLKTNRAIFVKGFSLNSYISIFSSLGTSIKNTYLYGIITIFIIVIMGMFIAYISIRRKNILTSVIDTITMFPYIIPGSVLGITLLLAFNKPPIILSGTSMIIIMSLVIRRMPYTLRSSSAILYQISTSMEEASISLGASQVKTFFKITAMMMLPGVISGAILSWITVINELSSSVILYTGKSRTMAVSIYQEVIRASYGTAAALSTILTLSTIISLLIFFKLTGKKEVSL
ncbi:iron ABC transporter permease [Brachyspira hyodysenteriae]|uniref:Permease BitE n=3 Tax=Brachyspira hyodysenteriae TaxID=159 RepID=A0A3B6VEV2_BRAHW|nr:iron ABC transporter permease [Brachyspira hyodysenteriae]ACN83364.1 putative permease BitE [Brachyspira hyodysenteriae WA1]ANN64493.1 iron ABC transporter permease [Brachyspira hyodysenteriae ATCC 27164]AUJ49101.1 iron ABC transporter permease [Brachyspira hyodysenteriae]KLI14638.1 iron ABC transporter permease [Brachyspira hyodysenteriae]KLI18180.1 iron ABC transporter permease [Brachyspira hyodysenteriae]